MFFAKKMFFQICVIFIAISACVCFECFSDATRASPGYGPTHIARLSPGETVKLSCSANIGLNNEFPTYATTDNNSSSLTIKDGIATRSVMYTAPLDNQMASKANGKKMKCLYKNRTCHIRFSVRFKPYIEPDFKTLTFEENQEATIECPIRAPNFPPYEYVIAWIVDNKVFF